MKPALCKVRMKTERHSPGAQRKDWQTVRTEFSEEARMANRQADTSSKDCQNKTRIFDSAGNR